METRAIVIETALELGAGTDVRAPGGVVTTALCGALEHDGPCRWPHNSQLDTTGFLAILRTVAVVEPGETADVLRRVQHALVEDERWATVRIALGELTPEEMGLAHRMANSSTP